MSRGKNSPLLGKTIQGKTKASIYKGRVVFED
jgi:dihydroorotase-like cyclic amidohydrolase